MERSPYVLQLCLDLGKALRDKNDAEIKRIMRLFRSVIGVDEDNRKWDTEIMKAALHIAAKMCLR